MVLELAPATRLSTATVLGSLTSSTTLDIISLPSVKRVPSKWSEKCLCARYYFRWLTVPFASIIQIVGTYTAITGSSARILRALVGVLLIAHRSLAIVPLA